MKKELYRVPGKVVGHHHPNINAIIDTWENMFITLEEWKSHIYDIGIVDYAPKNHVTTWIIDTSNGTGTFKSEVQEFRRTVASPKLEANGLKYFFVVLSKQALGKFSARDTAKIYGQGKMKTFAVGSVQEALDILKGEHAIPMSASI